MQQMKKKNCLKELHEFMNDARNAARKTVVKILAKGMEEENITQIDGQKYHDWTEIRRKLESLKKKNTTTIKINMYSNFPSSWWYKFENEVCTLVDVEYCVTKNTVKSRGFCAKALSKAINEKRKCFDWITKKNRKKTGKLENNSFIFCFSITS